MTEGTTFLALKWLQKQSLSMWFVSTTARCMLGCCHYKYTKLCTGHILLSYLETFTLNSYCAAISSGYTHPFYHTGWLDSTTTSQQWGPSKGGWASPGSWGQTRPSGQGEDRMGQCIQLRIGRWYIKWNKKPYIHHHTVPIFMEFPHFQATLTLITIL